MIIGHQRSLNISSSDETTSSDSTIVGRDRILQLLEEATHATTGGSPGDRLSAAFNWVNLATRWSHPSSLDAYRKSLELLEVVIATGSSLETRHLRLTSNRFKETQNLAVDAAACAIGLDQVEMALEMLEQGRSLLFNQAGRYRTPIDGLEDTLTEEFRAISARMEVKAMDTLGDVDPGPDRTMEDVVAVYVKRF